MGRDSLKDVTGIIVATPWVHGVERCQSLSRGDITPLRLLS